MKTSLSELVWPTVAFFIGFLLSATCFVSNIAVAAYFGEKPFPEGDTLRGINIDLNLLFDAANRVLFAASVGTLLCTVMGIALIIWRLIRGPRPEETEMCPNCTPQTFD